MLHANCAVLCFMWRKLLPIEVLHCGNRDFGPFYSSDLDLLTRWPSSMNMTHFPRDMPDARKWTSYVKVSKMIVWQTDRQTRPKLYTTPLSQLNNATSLDFLHAPRHHKAYPQRPHICVGVVALTSLSSSHHVNLTSTVDVHMVKGAVREP